MRSNGSFRGSSTLPSIARARGLWPLSQVYDARSRVTWPLAVGAGTAWNPSDKHANVTLSNNDRTASVSTGSYVNARATNAASSGKRYYEVLLSGTGTTNRAVGVVKASFTIGSNYVGYSDSLGWYPTAGSRVMYYNGTSTAYGEQATNNDVIGLLLDIDGGTVAFSKNGTVYASHAADGIISGATWYPCITLDNGDTMIANFNPEHWVYDPPSGYMPWLPP